MQELSDEGKLLSQLLTLISKQFGANCEVVLHDLKKDYDHTIIDIRNGHITNRKVGGCGSNLGLEVLNGSVLDGDRYNYVTTTPDGKILRSSSIYLRNEAGEVIGSVCINLDITETMRFEGFLRKYNHFDQQESEDTSGQEEIFAQDVNHLLDHLIQQAEELVGRPPKEMTKDERAVFLEYLDKKGAFQIAKSSIKICKILHVSKFTLYNDLDSIRENRPKQ